MSANEWNERESAATAGSGPARWVLLAMAAYALGLGAACQLKYRCYAYGDFDLAVHAQSVANILHGRLDSSILGIPFLGNHMVLILFLVAPLRALLPAPLLLLHLQTLALAAGAWAVYRLARDELDARWAAATAALYLLYPPLIRMNLYEFHPVALASTFLLFALLHLRRGRFPPFLACALLALTCQENVALVLVALAGYVRLTGRRGRWVWAPLLAGLVYLALVVGWLMPHLNPHVGFASLYAHWGETPGRAALNMLRHPLRAAAAMAGPGQLSFLTQLLAPLAFLPLLAPARFIPLLPVLAQRLLSARPTETTTAYHYQAEFIPFVFFAGIGGLAWLLRRERWPLARLALPAAALLLTALSLALGGTATRLARAPGPGPDDRARRARYDRALAAVPPHAPVLATFACLPRLADRPRLYSLHHVYSGCYTLSTRPYPTPAVDWIVLDTDDRLTFSTAGFYGPANHRRLQALLAQPGWRLARQEGSLLVFGRGATGAAPDSLVASVAADTPMHTRVRQEPGDGPRLRGFATGERTGDGLLPLTLYWQTGGAPAADGEIDLVLESAPPGNRPHPLTAMRLAPGSRIFPPQSWPAHGTIADRHTLPLPAPVAVTDLTVSVRWLPVRED